MAVLPTSLELSISVPGFASSSQSLPSSAKNEGGRRGAMRDLDINQVPGGGEGEEECPGGNAIISVEDDDDDDDSSSSNHSGSCGGGGPPRKKLRLTKEQSRLLEDSFRLNHTLNPKQKEALAMQLKLKPRQVEVWFQNRRARSKLKQTEMECEYLKRWYGSLTEQNRRLQKEVEELRALRVCPPTVFSPHSCEPLPASSLRMCPRCERVTSTALDKGPARTTSTAAAAAATPLSSTVPTITLPRSTPDNLNNVHSASIF